MKSFFLFLAIASFFVILPAAYPEELIPQIVIDKPACPFECCHFGKWTARSALVLYHAPNAKALSRKIRKGEMITALTGEAHSNALFDKTAHKLSDFVWWVNIRLQDGTEAWIKNPGGAFDGMDGCG